MTLTSLKGPLFWGALCLALAVGGQVLVADLGACLDLPCALGAATADPWVLGGVLALYVLLLAIPFVPGAEIGFLLLMLFGHKVVLAVYLATILAFVLAFVVGRAIAPSVLIGLSQRLGMAEFPGRVREAGLRINRRLARSDVAPGYSRWTTWLIQNRGVQLAALINTRGNSVIGGGGGIALMAGIGRWMSFRTFLISVSIAVAPVPAAVAISSLFSV